MRPKTVGIFAAGFATGLLCLAVLLWSTGRIPGARPQAATVREIHLPRSPLPDLSQADRIPRPAPPDAPPAVEIPGVAQGSADRLSSDAPKGHLGLPLSGVDVNHLADSFNDMRDGRKHEALDIPAPRGTPVHAVAQGNVAKLFTSKQGGLTVYQFDDSGNWCYYYAHLDHYAPSLKEGMLLRKGDVLGYVGTTGNAPPNVPHLHFAVFRLGPEKHWWQGQAVDPLPLLK
ncbi:MAG TPA: M23 family metallopeptidase [Candidatus Sulfopaludibacter sp.]|jgi:murein DD-endopeptidase MepM/ murein hydrolase activator NlpD|nr:M23 family metallopeptidase [Candidatus Sulfopaludibacter sp.]